MPAMPGTDPSGDSAIEVFGLPGRAEAIGSVIAGAGLSATRHEDAGATTAWVECSHGGWIVEGPSEVVAPQIHNDAVLALSPRPEGTVWLFTSAHPGGRPSTVAAAERVVALVYLSRSPRQRSEMLVSTLPSEGRPGHLGVLNDGMFAGRWLFGVAPHSPRWPADAPKAHADAAVDSLLRSLGWDFAGPVRANQPKHLHDSESGAEMVVLAVAEGEHRDGLHADRVAASAVSLTTGRESPVLAAVAAGRVWRVFKPEDARQRSVYVDTQAAAVSYVHAILSPGGLASPEFAAWADRDSRRYASDLSSSLRRRIHGTAMPKLSEAAARDMRRLDPGASLDIAFQAAVRILFRLLLIAWAEDEGILPYDRNDSYRRKSLTQQALRLANDPKLGASNGRGYSIFEDLKALWAVFDGGSAEMGVPAYNGGLFDNNTPIGQQIARLRLADRTVASVLRTLLTTDPDDDEPPGMADFSGMSVREFGTIYEELLEYRLSEAPQDLTADLTPADDAPGGDAVIAYVAGAPYLHDKSGQRKSTGSYFTKPFAVDHLLAEALHPALEEHLLRVAAVLATEGDAAASEALWDFAVLDPASGSGHFLVAACDMIAERFSKFQDNNSLLGVADALDRMRSAARSALEGRDPAAEAMITDRDLLARLAARKCLYAVDISEMATELCKVAMWVRTFVPGLPMYSLDHQIVSGNILLGVPSVDEAVDLLDPPKHRKPGQGSLAAEAIRAPLDRANAYETIARRLDESDHDEIEAASAARSDAGRALESARYLFDAALALRLGFLRTDRKGRIPETTDAESVVAMMRRQDESSGLAYAALRELDPHGRRPTHLPLMFPEVYRPDRPAGPGFDCVVGNPPWEKVIVDREAWWGLHIPGVRSDPVARRRARIDAHESSNPDLAEEFEADKQRAERLKKALRRAFPDLGSGHTDLYKAFCWANIAAVRAGGTVGMVLPRSAMSDAGMAKWRRRLFKNPGGGGGVTRRVLSLATIINRKGWAFDGVHNSYTVALVVWRSPPCSPASTPASGPLTESTDATRSPSSPSATLTPATTPGGIFEDTDAQEPVVAIYPGPAQSLDHFEATAADGPEKVPVTEFLGWSNTAAFPQIPTKAAFKVWRKIKSHPRFDGEDLRTERTSKRERERETTSGNGGSGQSRETSTPARTATDSSETMGVPPSRGASRDPRQGQIHEGRRFSGQSSYREPRFRIVVAETTTTAYRQHWIGDDGAAAASRDEGVWPVYHGKSFDLWTPDTGNYYDSCKAETMIKLLQQRRQSPGPGSPHYGFSDEHLADPQTLACQHPRIAVRDIARANDTRTLIAALIPPGRILPRHAAYALASESTTAAEEAFTLGVLCSMPCDWQARRRAELHMGNSEILGGLSIPEPGDDAISLRLTEIAARLASTDERFDGWASNAGVTVDSVGPDERGDLLLELDACAAALYGLDEDDITVLYDTFGRPGQWDDRRDKVIQHWRRITT